jgi:hypothetical protein
MFCRQSNPYSFITNKRTKQHKLPFIRFVTKSKNWILSALYLYRIYDILQIFDFLLYCKHILQPKNKNMNKKILELLEINGITLKDIPLNIFSLNKKYADFLIDKKYKINCK